MRRYWRLFGLSAGMLLAARALAVAAVSTQALQGAWTADGANCDQVFEKSGGHIRFKDINGTKMQGMIVSGKKIVVPSGTCTAHRIVPKGDYLSVDLQCADAIISTSLSVAFKFTDAEHFVRMNPLFPENAYGYHKCNL